MDPVRGQKLLIRIDLLPSLRDQEEQIWTIDGYLAGENREPKLTPHDM